jgi:hypothetical protein
VIVTNFAGSATSQVAVLTVGGWPVIQTQPQNQTVVQGSNATFSVVAGGKAPLSYQWWFNTTNLLTDATNSSVTLNSVQAANAGTYRVVVTNLLGSVTSTPALLTVLTPPAITAQPQDIVAAVNKTVTFSVSVTGTQPLGSVWSQLDSSGTVLQQFPGVPTTNQGVLEFLLPVGSGSSNAVYNYMAVVTNAWGMVTSRVATLTVMTPPTITNQPQTTSANVGDTVFLTVGVTGTQPLSYQWQFNGTNLGLPLSTNVLELDNVGTNNTGNYQVIVTNFAGSATSQVAKLLVGYTALTPPQLWLLTHSVGDGDSIQIALEAGKNYRVQASSDMFNWFDVTNFLSSSELMTFTNSMATNVNQLFYRVVSP